ncbi:MAG: CoA transferase [Pseudonocardia sp.]|nr:CoA transferase [Pseudonocardia sp.]
MPDVSPGPLTTRAPGALSAIRVCDLSGQLAGAGATRFLAAFGAEVIRIEDPVDQGRWDIIRGGPPYVDGRQGNDLGGAFNNHNVEKLGVTLNLRTARGRELLERLVAVSDVVTENFSAGVMERLGFGYARLRELREDVVYVSNSGFGHTGPYVRYKTFGPIVQAVSGLTFLSGLPGRPPAGWGYSYMDHMGGNVMATAILAALVHRNRTGEGQWVDMACAEAAVGFTGPGLLDATVNGRPQRTAGPRHSNRDERGEWAPHGIYPAAGEDRWVALACRCDDEWRRIAELIDEPWTADFSAAAARLAEQDRLDGLVGGWTRRRGRDETVKALQAAGVPADRVATPQDRVDDDPATAGWGLWPEVEHTAMGRVRVDGVPAHLSETDWRIERGGPCLGEHNERVFCGLLGLRRDELAELAEEGVV